MTKSSGTGEDESGMVALSSEEDEERSVTNRISCGKACSCNTDSDCYTISERAILCVSPAYLDWEVRQPKYGSVTLFWNEQRIGTLKIEEHSKGSREATVGKNVVSEASTYWTKNIYPSCRNGARPVLMVIPQRPINLLKMVLGRSRRGRGQLSA